MDFPIFTVSLFDNYMRVFPTYRRQVNVPWDFFSKFLNLRKSALICGSIPWFGSVSEIRANLCNPWLNGLRVLG
jgi:hypothetical protein